MKERHMKLVAAEEKKKEEKRAKRRAKKEFLRSAAQKLLDLQKEFAAYKKKTEQPQFQQRPKYRKGMVGIEFYQTRKWRELRWKAIELSEGKCEVCGLNKNDGVILHVDHIKPRSKYPELELDINNLQILCEDCNLGKLDRIQNF
jgi:5-methylcytosine-specific restriction endonuclease McrA